MKNIIILEDWNATVGERNADGIVGRYGVRERNARGDRLIELFARNKLIFTNTLFQHHARRCYTWKAPGDIRRPQIDYILI